MAHNYFINVTNIFGNLFFTKMANPFTYSWIMKIPTSARVISRHQQVKDNHRKQGG